MKFESRPLLLRVIAELGRGRVFEGYVQDRKDFVDGVCDGQEITINPLHQTIDTVLHECLHRAYPDWSETYVRNRTTFLRRRMTDEEAQEVYRIYQSLVKKRKRTKDLE
jgi:hypothetical protein